MPDNGAVHVKCHAGCTAKRLQGALHPICQQSARASRPVTAAAGLAQFMWHAQPMVQWLSQPKHRITT